MPDFVVIAITIGIITIGFDGAHRSRAKLDADGAQSALRLCIIRSDTRLADLHLHIRLVPSAQQDATVVSGIERQLGELRGIERVLFFATRDRAVIAADPEMGG